MNVGFVSLFPEHIAPWASSSIIGKAVLKGLLHVEYRNPRDFTYDRHNKVDDAPFGGEPGMLIKAEPVALAIESLSYSEATIILTDPAGPPFTQTVAQDLAQRPALVFLCGHYEGIDDRVAEAFCAERYSIGDYILTSGELAAMVMADAIARNLNHVLGDPKSLSADSHSNGLLSAPNYTTPDVWRGLAIPEVLKTGHHIKIEAWRREQALRITRQHRPDLLATANLTQKDLEILSELD